MDFELWWLLGIPVFFALGWIAARVDINQLVSESRSLPRNYFKGLNFLLTEQHDKAIDAFIEIVKLDPESADMHFALGNLFRRRGETERAIRVHQNLLARPDLALLQDMDRTRDPATGTVPSERLLAAARYNEGRLKNLAQRGTATTGLANAAWVERGPSNVAGRLLALLVDPTDATGNTVWAGAAGGGLWKATNASSASIAWTNVNSYFNNLAVSAIAAVPGTSPQVMYCGTGEGFYNGDAIRGGGTGCPAQSAYRPIPGPA